jgi:APA family basic amino acid/polyamine antiporter
MDNNEGLKRNIGTWGLTSNIINTIIGAGIFVLPAIVTEGLGAASFLAYLFCGFLMTMILLCFAEAGSKVTITGGAYAYIEAAFGKYAGFLTTNLFIFGASLMATAAVANAVADTLTYLIPIFGDKLFRIFFFITLFTGLTIINVVGVSRGIALVKITTIAKLTPLVLLIIAGLTHLKADNFSLTASPSIKSFGAISLILFFAFQGAENSLSVSGEIKDPVKTIPKSILLSTVFVLVIYLFIQLVAQGVVGNSLSEYKGAPLAEVARRIIGPFGKTIMIFGAAVSMFGYLSSDILNMPRVLFRSSRDEVLPIKALGKVHPRFATPYIAIISFTTLSCILSITGGFKQLAILSTSSVLLIYLGVALAVIKMRKKETVGQNYFKIPGGYTVPVISIAIILWFLSNLEWKEVMYMTGFIALLSVIYFVIRYYNRKI